MQTEWTTTQPTEPGLYWCFMPEGFEPCDGKTLAVTVHRFHTGKLQASMPFYSEPLGANFWHGAEWLGPIKHPERNIPEGAAFVVIRRSDMHKFVIYANGRIEGFPDDCFIVNRIMPKLNQAACLMKKHGVPDDVITDFMSRV